MSWEQPKLSACVFVIDRTLPSTSCRSSGVVVRIDRRKIADCAMTLPALPEMNAPTVTTALLCGETLRDTMVCSAMTSEEPATTGSMLSSGIDP
jgi:hypothetical protein